MTRRLLALVPRRQAGVSTGGPLKVLLVNWKPRSSSATGPVSPPKDPAEGAERYSYCNGPWHSWVVFSAAMVVAASGLVLAAASPA
jgi:hypothetical protein